MGGSIHKYLWRIGKVTTTTITSTRSISSGEGSPSFSDLEAACIIGGHSISSADIEYNILKMKPMVPKKGIAVYGYGSVAWKDRIEDWKKRQNDKLQVVKHEGMDILNVFLKSLSVETKGWNRNIKCIFKVYVSGSKRLEWKD